MNHLVTAFSVTARDRRVLVAEDGWGKRAEEGRTALIRPSSLASKEGQDKLKDTAPPGVRDIQEGLRARTA